MSYGITHWNGCGDVDTPEHAGCKKRSELPVTLDVGDYTAGFSDGYGRGLTDAARHAIKERVILTDLITELRDGHRKSERFGDCVQCEEVWPCERVYLANEAETRLKGLTDE